MTDDDNINKDEPLGDHPDLDFDSGYKGHIVARIRTDMVEWLMRWDKDSNKPDEMIFEDGMALAVLLANEKVFIQPNGNDIKIHVLCNDTFMWGCSDCERLERKDIEPVYRHWIKDTVWGTEVWCIIKRGEMPQKPVEDNIREGGIWDLDALKTEHNLKPNYYDGVSRVVAGLKYDRYSEWKNSQGLEPLIWDKHWWSGWNEYVAAHPNWRDDGWKAEEDRRIAAWRSENGWDDEEKP